MKINKYLVFAFLLIILPVKVLATDTLTITYDANDGSGRTKTVVMDKGPEYTLLGSDIFEYLDDDPDDPQDDRLISRWTVNSDNSDWGYCAFCTYKPNGSSTSVDNYNFFNDASEIYLYAQWEKREDLKPHNLVSETASGEGVTTDDNGNYDIAPQKSFRIVFSFKETSDYQIGQLTYYDMPEYFMRVLPEDMIKELEEPAPLTVKISEGYTTYTYIGSYFIKNNKLYIDMPADSSIESSKLYAVANVKINIIYEITWTYRQVNNRWMYVATVRKGLSQDSPVVDIYPKGKIIIKCVDIETGEELILDIKQDVLGTKFEPEEIAIDGYHVVSMPDEEYEFDEENQTIVIKYEKNNPEPNELDNQDIPDNPETDADNPIIFIVTLILSSTILSLIASKKYLLNNN